MISSSFQETQESDLNGHQMMNFFFQNLDEQMQGVRQKFEMPDEDNMEHA